VLSRQLRLLAPVKSLKTASNDVGGHHFFFRPSHRPTRRSSSPPSIRPPLPLPLVIKPCYALVLLRTTIAPGCFASNNLNCGPPRIDYSLSPPSESKAAPLVRAVLITCDGIGRPPSIEDSPVPISSSLLVWSCNGPSFSLSRFGEAISLTLLPTDHRRRCIFASSWLVHCRSFAVFLFSCGGPSHSACGSS